MAIVNLSGTVVRNSYQQLFDKCQVNEARELRPSAAFSHVAFPGLSWRVDLYPRGDSRAEPNYATVAVCADFGSEEGSITSVWAKSSVTLVTGGADAKLRKVGGQTVAEYLKDGTSSWGFHNAFRQDVLKTAANSNEGRLELKVDLSIYKIIDVLKCRDSVRALLSAIHNQHANVKITVEGKQFKVHRAILAKQCTGFREAVPAGTTSDAYSAFLGAVYYDSFEFLPNCELAFGVLQLSVTFGSIEIKEVCDHALAALIPKLGFTVLLQILPEAIRLDALATKSSCIRALSERKEILTSPEWTAFKGTARRHVFQAICDALLEKTASGELVVGEPNEPGSNDLAALIESLDVPGFLNALRTAILEGSLARKAVCVRALSKKKDILTSAAWTRFKAKEDRHVLHTICDVLIERSASGLSPTVAVHRSPEVTLSHTWPIPRADLLIAIGSESTPVTSEPFAEHAAFPGLKWQVEFYPRGNAQDADYKPGFASLYLKADFSSTRYSFKAVYAQWKATILVNDELKGSTQDSSDYILYTGATEMKFGYANAFRSDQYDKALKKSNKSKVALKLDLTIASVPEILKCRDLFSSLYTDKTHADVEIHVDGTIFNAHKFILAIRSTEFAEMLKTVTLGKIEIKHTTPQAFEAFMAAIYYEHWNFLSDLDAVIAVLKLAGCYAVADLKQYCVEALAHFVNESNASKILPHATIHNADATKAACLEILFANEEVMKSGGWEKCKACTDFKFHVNGKIIEGNKSILSARSAVFTGMFEADMEESKKGMADLKETTTPKAFELFLAGVYYDSWSFLTHVHETIEVLGLAEMYGVADLKRYCDEALAQFAEASNLFEILPHAAFHNADTATSACVEILFANEQMMKSDEWKNFKKEANKDIAFQVAEALGELYRKK